MAEAVMTTERRFHPRIACSIPLATGKAIHNMSQNGLYFETDHEHEINSQVSLKVSFPGSNIPVTLSGRVVRRADNELGRFGYGVCLKNLSPDAYQQINYFILYQRTNHQKERSETATIFSEGQIKILSQRLVLKTEQQNLIKIDPRLEQFLSASDYFSVHDITKDLQLFVEKSGIVTGTLTVQILHTSATLCVNELDEPMLLMDIARKLRDFAPKEADYLHNGPMREVNLCPDDVHCDRNGDAHVKASLFGVPSVTLIIENGMLVLGQWQKVALLEFDGPRRREVLAQVLGT